MTSREEKKRIYTQIKLVTEFYKKTLKKNPRIAITGLNPHCESNFKNCEEDVTIIPAIKHLKSKNFKVQGPFPADTIFMSKNLKENYVIDVPDDLSSSVEQTSYEMCFINFFFSFCFEQGETPPRDASIASHSEKMDSTTSTTSTFFSSSGTAEAAIRNEDPPRESVSERGRATYNRWVHQFQAANCEQSDYMYDGQVLPIENLIIPKQKSSGSHTTTTISGSSNIFANAGDFTIPIQMKRKRTQESTDEGPSNKKKHAPTRMAALTWDSSWDETTPILESFVF